MSLVRNYNEVQKLVEKVAHSVFPGSASILITSHPGTPALRSKLIVMSLQHS
jgi:hypothetical protein